MLHKLQLIMGLTGPLRFQLCREHVIGPSSAESLGDTGLLEGWVTHWGNKPVVSMPSTTVQLPQKRAHSVFSSRTMQLLLTRLPYLPEAENLLAFQQGAVNACVSYTD